MQNIYSDIDDKFNDFSPYETELKKAFIYYKHYFPDSATPNIITFYSNFNSNIFPFENNLAIGLDMYLGKENKIVKNLPPEHMPQYIKDRMEPEYMVADAVKYFLLNKFSEESNSDFLTEIIEIISTVCQ